MFGAPKFPPPPYQSSPGQSEASLSTASQMPKHIRLDPPPYSEPLCSPPSRILESIQVPIRHSSLRREPEAVSSYTTHLAIGSLGLVVESESREVALITSVHGESSTRRPTISPLVPLGAVEEKFGIERSVHCCAPVPSASAVVDVSAQPMVSSRDVGTLQASLAPPPYQAGLASAPMLNHETPKSQVDRPVQFWHRAKNSRFTLKIRSSSLPVSRHC